jgi:Activator of Hsp90 ATPase homolog 1-like protein
MEREKQMPDIKHAIQIDAPPNRVFPLVASADGFKQWWAADVSGNDAAGPIELGFFNRSTVYRLRSNESTKPQHASWLCESGKEWSGTRLLFDLTEQNGKTQLRFTHADWAAETEYFTSCNTTWGELMFRLKAAAEGKSPGPLFTASGFAY